MAKPQFYGNTPEDLTRQIAEALTEVKFVFGEIVPVITTEDETEHELISWSLESQDKTGSRVQYGDNTNIPRIFIDASLKKRELHTTSVFFEKTAIDELKKRQKKQLEIKDEAIRSALGLAIETRAYNIFLNGMDGEVSGIFNLSDAQDISSSLSGASEIKKALIEARKKILESGAKTTGMFTVLMPMRYEDLMKDPMTEAIIDSTEDYLARQYSFVFDYSFDYEKIVVFQDTYSNIYFHRDVEIEIDPRLAYENTSERWYATLTLSGLVVKNEEQVCYITAPKRTRSSS